MKKQFVFFLISFQFVFLLLRPFPVLTDDWYHLSVIRAFYEKGGVQLWDDWEFAPQGRPHLYPPLFHMTAATIAIFFGQMGLQNPLMAALLFLNAVSYPLLLLSLWWLSKELFGKEAAFYSLLLALGVLALFFSAQVIVPSAYALAFVNFLAGAFFRKRAIASAILLSLTGYTHLGVFLLALLFLLVFSLTVRRDYLRQFVLVGSAASVLCLPWLFHVASNASWFGKGVNVPLGVTIPIIVWLAALPTVLEKPDAKGRRSLPLAYLAALLPMLPFYGHRFWVYALIPLSILGGRAIANLEGSRKTAASFFIVASLLWCAPTLYDEGSIDYFLPDTHHGILVESPLSVELTKLRLLDSPVSREERELAAWIGSNVEDGGIVGADGWRASSIHALSGRRTSGGAWPEVAPSRRAEYRAGLVVCDEPCPNDSELVAKIGGLELRER